VRERLDESERTRNWSMPYKTMFGKSDRERELMRGRERGGRKGENVSIKEKMITI